MSNDIKSIASIQGLFNRKYVDIYQENDLMKPVGMDMYGGVRYTIEEFEVQGNVSGNYAVGLCVNSYPFFCRYDLCEYGDGTQRQSWLENLNRNSSVTGQMKDVGKYERTCPKCGWGVSAYLAIRCKHDERFGIRYFDRKGNETSQRKIFASYMEICHAIYKAVHQDEYRHYEAIEDVEATDRLEAAFIHEHRQNEEQYRRKSKDVGRLFFAGKLDNVAGEYLKYIAGVEAGGSQADKWVIPDDCLVVFGGDRKKAGEYLKQVIGKGYGASRYGLITKRLINKQRGYGKLVWLMICANDNTQKPESITTFNKYW